MRIAALCTHMKRWNISLQTSCFFEDISHLCTLFWKEMCVCVCVVGPPPERVYEKLYTKELVTYLQIFYNQCWLPNLSLILTIKSWKNFYPACWASLRKAGNFSSRQRQVYFLSTTDRPTSWRVGGQVHCLQYYLLCVLAQLPWK